MRLAEAGEMKALDAAAIKEFGISGLVLMENAGRQVVEVIRRVIGEVSGKNITIFAGKGNNGGDGFVAARHLHNMGAGVKVMLLASSEEISGDAAVNMAIWQKMKQKTYNTYGSDNINIARLALMNTDIIVDAIYGTGFKGKVGERVGRIIEVLNNSGRPIVAVDIPSGLEADSGKVNGPCVKADHTVTFGLPKLGLVLEPGAQQVGRLHVADISIPAVLVEKLVPPRYLVTAALVREWLPQRPAVAHKGNFGHVLVVAGSRGMTGAACLAGEGALRAGAGLVTVAVPETLHGILEAKLTEVMTVPLPDTGSGNLSKDAGQRVMSLLEEADVLAMGPGLSNNIEVADFVKDLLPFIKIPCVLDADALNALGGAGDLLKKVKAPLVITPHPGEMARLTGIPVGEIQENRLSAASKSAREWDTVVLLKGARTIVASPDGAVFVNSTGNPGMATAGSGDVLTGAVAALLAQGMEPARAAAAGAYLHGLSGDLAAADKGQMGLLAGDLLYYVPQATRLVFQDGADLDMLVRSQ